MSKRGKVIKKIKKNTQLPGEWVEIEVECPECHVREHVYIYDDDKTCYCIKCLTEFEISETINTETGEIILEYNVHDEDLNDVVSDDPEKVKQFIESDTTRKAIGAAMAHNQTKGYTHFEPRSYCETSGVDYSYNKICYHHPQHVIAGEGWGVWAGKKEDCRISANDYDVVLNLTWAPITEKHVIPMEALKKYENEGSKFEEIQMDWPDFGIINLGRDFWVDLLKYCKDNKKKLLIFCKGGHGRTGTAVAILMCLALGYTPEKAIEWVRKNYCVEAIESAVQEFYIKKIAKEPEFLPEVKQEFTRSAAVGNES